MVRKYFAVSVIASVFLAAPVLGDMVRGVITKVDLDKKEVVVRAKGRGVRKGSLTFTLGKDARVLVGRRAGSLKNLQVGRRVRVEYGMQDDRRIVTEIRIKGGIGIKDGKPILGKLLRVSLPDREIIVLGRMAKGEKKTEITLNLPAVVTVTRGGKPLKLEDLKEGAFVRVLHRSKDGKLVATSIQVIDAEAIISRARQTINTADFYLKMAEWYLKTLEKPKKAEQKK